MTGTEAGDGNPERPAELVSPGRAALLRALLDAVSELPDTALLALAGEVLAGRLPKTELADSNKIVAEFVNAVAGTLAELQRLSAAVMAGARLREEASGG